jgi:Tol biopolymer transport system component
VLALLLLVTAPAPASASIAAMKTPQMFAPGIVSEAVADSSPTFSRDGATMYFEHSDPTHSEIRVSTRQGESWSPPALAPFSGTWRDIEPTLAADGSFLVFASNRPAGGHGAPLDGHWRGQNHEGKGGALWRVDQRNGKWGRPWRLAAAINSVDATFEPSLAADGSLYFMRADGPDGRWRLYRAASAAADTVVVEPLPFSDGSGLDVDPAIAPDQSFMVFCSDRGAGERGTGTRLALHIVFRREGKWGTPIRLPDEINGTTSNTDVRLSPDLSTLYFSHDRLVWHTPLQPVLQWARAQVGIAPLP